MKTISVFTIIILSIFWTFNLQAQVYTFEDPAGNFQLEIPKSWEKQSQQQENLFVFTNGAKSMIIQFLEGADSEDELFELALNTFKGAGAKNTTTSDVKGMSLNGRAARWGIGKGEVDVNAAGKVSLYGLSGSALLENGGIYFLTITNEQDYAEWREEVESSFLSIRGIDEEKQAPTNITSISETTVSKVSGESKVWEHKLLTMTMAPGWGEKTLLPNMEKEVIGWFDYTPINGATMMALAYKGVRMTKSLVQEAAQKTVTISIPNAQLVNSYEIDLKGNNKATVSVYQGSVPASGQEVGLTAVTTVFKAKKSIVALVGFSASIFDTKEFENKINESAQSAQ